MPHIPYQPRHPFPGSPAPRPPQPIAPPPPAREPVEYPYSLPETPKDLPEPRRRANLPASDNNPFLPQISMVPSVSLTSYQASSRSVARYLGIR